MIETEHAILLKRVATKQFCTDVQAEVGSAYRPYLELMRLLTVSEAWSASDGINASSLLVVPFEADAAVASAMRVYAKITKQHRGCFLTPPIGAQGALAPLIQQAIARANRHAPCCLVWAMLEYREDSLQLLDTYFSCGFLLCALRPMHTLAPYYLLRTATPADFLGERKTILLSDSMQIALHLSRGWVAVAVQQSANGDCLLLYRQ